MDLMIKCAACGYEKHSLDNDKEDFLPIYIHSKSSSHVFNEFYTINESGSNRDIRLYMCPKCDTVKVFR